MRSSVGYFCPAWYVGGLTIRPCTSVPSLLVDVNSSVVAEQQLRQPVVVLVRQPAQLAVLERVRLRPARCRSTTSTANAPSGAPADRLPTTRFAGDQPLDLAAVPPATTRAGYCERSSTTTNASDAPSFDHMRLPDRAIERLGEEPRLAAGRRDRPRACSGCRRSTSAPRRRGRRSACRRGSTRAARRRRPATSSAGAAARRPSRRSPRRRCCRCDRGRRSPRLLTKAIRVPSGDQAGVDSSSSAPGSAPRPSSSRRRTGRGACARRAGSPRRPA